MDNSITILVGDNGCGKSTLLESLALHLNLPLIGGCIREKDGFEAARILQSYLEIDWKKQMKKGFFFRAEDFSDFINSVEREKDKIAGDLHELRGQVDDSVIREMTERTLNSNSCVGIMETICRLILMERLT